MKKSTLLSLATAGAIVATSAFTFAAWDTLDVKQSVSLTYGKPVVVSMDALTVTDNKALGGLNGEKSVEIPVTVKIADYTPESSKDDIKLSVVNSDGAALTPTGIDVKFKKSNTELSDNTDTAPGVTNSYTAVVTLNNDAVSTESNTEDLSIKAELVHTEPSA